MCCSFVPFVRNTLQGWGISLPHPRSCFIYSVSICKPCSFAFTCKISGFPIAFCLQYRVLCVFLHYRSCTNVPIYQHFAPFIPLGNALFYSVLFLNLGIAHFPKNRQNYLLLLLVSFRLLWAVGYLHYFGIEHLPFVCTPSNLHNLVLQYFQTTNGYRIAVANSLLMPFSNPSVSVYHWTLVQR